MRLTASLTIAAAVILFAGSLCRLPAAVCVNAVVRNVSNNQPQSSGINFSLMFSSDMVKVAQQYIQLYYEPYRNVPSWRLDVYTENTAAAPSLTQRGGMIELSSATQRIPLAWKVSGTVATPQAVDITTTTGSGWSWLYDHGDTDNPYTTSVNENWNSVYGAGKTTLASGGLALSNPATCYVYLEGDFEGAQPGTYGGTIWFELFQVLDSVPPVISHSAVDTIVSRGNKIVLQATVTDETMIVSSALHYQLNNGAWMSVSGVASSTSTAKNAFYSYSIPAADLSGVSTIRYYLTATDGYNTVSYKSQAAPQVVTIGSQIAFNAVTSGDLVVPDGNAKDGNTKLSIPAGALASPVTITIEQLDTNDTALLPSRASRYAEGRRPVAAFDFRPNGQKFLKPIDLTLLYLADDANEHIRLADGTVLSDAGKDDLKIFFWDGFDWRALGGVVDETMNTVTVKTDHFSVYALFYQPALTADDYRPKEKIITPATADGINDYASFDGLAGEDATITIYNLKGRKVKSIAPSAQPRWDGTDENGTVVESGVYLYQFTAKVDGSNKLISGTIIVAK